MKKCIKINLSLALFFIIHTLYGQKPESITITSNEIILYVVDSVWNTFNDFTYTSALNGRSKIEVDPGYHCLEFKYPAVGWKGKIYSAVFFAENGKKYTIRSFDTCGYNPVIFDQTNKLVVKDAVIKQISVPKPETDTFRLPDVEGQNIARLTTGCCAGLYNGRHEFINLNNVIHLFKIDEFWGPYSISWNVGFNRGIFNDNPEAMNFELTPGLHKFYFVAKTPVKFIDT